MSLTDKEINARIGMYILGRADIPRNNVKVLEVYEETYNGGYCETCSYEDQRMVVKYRDAEGEIIFYDADEEA